ncbi:2-oxoglutarate dehydrogenase, E2 component, dihydrolipoamide succinyltransferase [Nakamurella flavida]|uniref:Dihydrolipoamide acetyltransferase component of pyruvate dehydrogenase complex n=1 Tax=Nakamurella flavida TaxID=363630 RepID=A0A938YHH2_9ACTN|nr:2-oxoglutarate dehydrogenase, E2 component, dihydrolipoamide succinyltransferase [Nakamurella flavida]MBM9474843.1 2-oxoglutarate dehydrogenase, E2 component, dihydrolipoamide succinyltransferase [Nakamurella flavida]MDP9776413.1 2-oxoglutarate dehydrogenase E2 component (dihydrolipoamide succinyltransferase) [Nakamurella flavida]
MSHSVQMPALGESVTEGTVTRWLKQVGDEVAVDEPLLEVSTDKVDTEIPSPVAGVLERIVVAEDETAEVGAELAVIGDGSGGESSDDGPAADEQVTEGGSGDLPPDAEGAAEDEAATGVDAQPEPEAGPLDSSAGNAPDAPSTDAEVAAEKPTAGTASAAQGTAVTLPEMGESVTEGTVTRWLKKVGDQVAVDEPLLEVSTDKVDTEVPSPVAGTLLEISVAEDETVEVGAQLALIGDASAASPELAPKPAEPAAKAPEAEAPAPRAEAPAPKAEPKDTVPAEQPEETEPPKQAEAEPAKSTEPSAPSAPAAPAAASTPSWQPPAVESTGAAGYVTPVIRKFAAGLQVDLASVSGTGVGGRIRREDVQAAADAAAAAQAAPPAAPAPAEAAPAAAAKPSAAPSPEAAALIGTTVKLPRIRQSIAKNMLAGLHTAAQLTTVIEVDVTRVAALRARSKAAFEAREGVKLSFLPFFVKATLEAAKQFPIINSTISDDLKELTYHPAVNLGIAVDTPRGLIVPVIKNADDLNLGGIARKIADLAARTRNNKIGPDELSGGTLTVTNTGSVGALFDTPIFVPPQSAILGTGAIVKRPAVIQDADGNDVIAIRSMCYLALSYDHRNIDGADASRFLGAVKKRIEAGEFSGDLGL